MTDLPPSMRPHNVTVRATNNTCDPALSAAPQAEPTIGDLAVRSHLLALKKTLAASEDRLRTLSRPSTGNERQVAVRVAIERVAMEIRAFRLTSLIHELSGLPYGCEMEQVQYRLASEKRGSATVETDQSSERATTYFCPVKHLSRGELYRLHKLAPTGCPLRSQTEAVSVAVSL